MKVCATQGMIAILLCGISMAHNNHAQLLDKEVTISLTDVSMEKALVELSNVTNIKFAYSLDQLDVKEKISIQADKRPLRDVLNELLTPRNIKYKVHELELTISLKKYQGKNDDQSALPGEINEYRSTKLTTQITGTVTDVDMNPMAGVTILVKGTTNGTSTDQEGKYSLSANDKDVLVFSFIGYASVEEQVNGRSTISVTLIEDIVTLKDVVVNAGYWDVNNKERTGNISRITAEEIQKQPVSNPLAALMGKMPGVYVQQGTGNAGGAVNIQIRGVNSLRPEGNNPLYLIDGVPFTASTLSSSNVGGEIVPAANPLNNINPADIESIEILKDADATAIYGSRGANGVVLITTKKGRAGRTSLNLNFYQGFSNVARSMDLLNTPQYLEMRREALKNDGLTASASNSPDLVVWDTTRYTDWQKELIGGTAYTTNMQSSLSGGSDNTQFLFSIGYYRETSVFPGDFVYQKASGHFNLNHVTPDKKFNVTLSLSYNADGNNLPRQDLTAQAVTLQPVAPPVYDDNGNLNWANGTWTNPMASLLRRYESKTNNLISNTTLSYAIIPDLILKANLGYTDVVFTEVQTNPRASFNPAGNFFSSVSWGDNAVKTWIIEPQLEYSRKISKASLKVLLGSTFQESNQESQTYRATGFPSDALLSNIQSATSITTTNWNSTQYKYHAVFSRINLEWNQKYILNLTARRDGSSRFGEGNQFANFGAAGLAWIFSEESFIKNNIALLSFGKIRTSYGLTGSDQIPDYGYLETYSSSLYPYQGGGLYPTRLANKNYGWETNKKFEAAVDLGFFNDNILLSTSYYRNNSSNQLVGYSLPATTGQSTVQANLPAVVQNTGWEFELTTRNNTNGSLNWSASMNFTVPENTLVEFPNIESSSYANTYVVGKSLFVLKRVHYTGVDPLTGVYTFEDVDGNGSGTNRPADLQAIKEVTQDFYGGFRNTVSWKGLELDIFFQFVSQTGRNYLNSFTNQPGSRLSNQPAEVMERWQNPGDISGYQQFTTRPASNAGAAYRNVIFDSDRIVSDASFIRLKNVQVSYQFPSKWLGKIKLQNARIYTQGQNLLTFTRFKGLDPESQLTFALPPLRTFTLGIQLTL